jgi:NAD+ kinase
MKIAIFGEVYNINSETSIETLLGILVKKTVKVIIESNFYLEIKNRQNINVDAFDTFEGLDDSFDLLITIGGDGTILRAITYVRDYSIPIIGVNTGRLGFLATIQKDKIEGAMEDIIKGNYQISQRSLLTIETDPENQKLLDFNIALNDIAVSRKNTTSMITVETYLNNEYLTSYWADGLIISTPTGSTGYSLSCGGPVIIPDADSFALTPIAPHNLNARPLVIPDSTEIKLRISGREDSYFVSLDSRIATLSNDSTIIIKKASFKIKMVELKKESFLDTLRKKLLWGADKRN